MPNQKVDKPADFKKYYDSSQKRNIWVLGYFGGGSVNIFAAMELAKEYAEENNVPLNTVVIDEILYSRRYKHFKYLYSTHRQPIIEAGASIYSNVFEMLSD